MSYNIVGKGNINKSAQGFVAPAQYIVLSENDKRYLLLRFENGRGELPSSIEIELTERDFEGEIISKKCQTYDIESSCEQYFSIAQKIELSPNCEDFSATVVAAQFGGYLYTAQNQMEYRQSSRFEVDKVSGRLTKNPQVTKRRQKLSPFLCVAVLVLSVVLSVFCYAQFTNYRRNTHAFYYNGIRYEFLDPADKTATADIIVAGASPSTKRVVIGGSVLDHKIVGIKSSAFENNTAITHLEIEGDLFIADNAFKRATSLQSIDIAAVTRIGEGAFYGCTSLASFSSETALFIGKDAFAYSGLGEIRLDNPDEIISIGQNAFSGLMLINADFNQYIDYGYGNSFFNGSTIVNLRLKNLNHAFTLGDNNYSFTNITVNQLFGKSADFYAQPINSLAIDFVDDISNSFCKNLGIESLTIKTLLNPVIGSSAFEGCLALSSLNLPINIERINSYAFSGSSIVALDAKALKHIGDFAFSNSDIFELYNLDQNQSMEYIGSFAFAGSDLKRFTVGGGVKKVEYGTFSGCFFLETLVIEHGVQEISASALYDCASLTELTVPSTVTTIASSFLRGCNALKSISLPFLGETPNSNGRLNELFGGITSYDYDYVPKTLKSVTLTAAKNIASFAFYSISSLETVTIDGSFTEIGTYAFADCPNLKSVTIGGAPKVVGAGAFSRCINLTNVEISPTIQRIESYAFFDCQRLSEFTLPETLHTIEDSAFSYCVKLYEIYNFSALKVERNSLGLGEVGFFALSIYTLKSQPRMVKFQSNGGTFAIDSQNKYKLIDYTLGETAVLPQNVRHNGQPFTYSIVKFLFYSNPVTEVTIPDGVDTIEQSAFSNCTNLKKVTIADSVLSIGESAFESCHYITELRLPFVGDKRASSLPLAYIFNYSSFEALKVVTVTDQTHIPNSAFANFSGLETVNLPQNLISIDAYAFNSTPVKNVVLPNSIEEIGNYAFMYSKIERITLPASLKTVGVQAFSYSKLAVVTLYGTPKFEQTAFRGCYKLLEVYNLSGTPLNLGSSDMGGIAQNALFIYTDLSAAPMQDASFNGLNFKFRGSTWVLVGFNEELSDLNLDAFTYQGKTVNSYSIVGEALSGAPLKSVRIGSAVTAIGEYALSACMLLKTLDMSDSELTEIPLGFAFNCTNLSNLTLPSNLLSIGAYAFMHCVRLNFLTIPSKVNYINTQAFSYCTSLFHIDNKSGLSLVAGSSEHGQVAFYALSTSPLTTVTTIDGFSFVRFEGQWYLMAVPNTSPSIVLPRGVEYDGITYGYVLTEGAFHQSSLLSLYVPKTISRIMKSPSTASIYIDTLYFGGSQSEWTALNLTAKDNRFSQLNVEYNYTIY